MLANTRLLDLNALLLASWALFVGASAALAQSPSSETLADPGAVSDDLLTLVVGTRFVASSENEQSAKAQFTDARIPRSEFNETDHCIDQSALEAAKEYFASLGRMLAKAGHYYFLPEAEIKKSLSMCEKLHGRPPKAWVEERTKIIAFGKVVPTADAPALEESVR